MAHKVKIEIDPDGTDEIVIRCTSLTPEVLALQKLIEDSGGQREEIELTIGDTHVLVDIEDILFFETENSHTYAHTQDKMYSCQDKLYELLEKLPKSFTRVSKSCVLNTRAVSALSRGVTGVCQVSFQGTDKVAYVSRMYYKPFRLTLKERLGQ